MFSMRLVPLVATVAAMVFSVISGASAAPQVLGLVATLTPVPLHCESGTCKAEFSSFCLQKERAVPHAKWAYEVATANSLQLVLLGDDGRTRKVDASSYIAIRAPRGFTAVEISIPSEALKSLGAIAASVEVADGAALSPVARSDDRHPITPEEKSLATGPLRALGSQMVDRDPEVLMTSRVLNGLINALPDAVRVGAGAQEALWQNALSSGLVARNGTGNAVARSAYDACWKNAPVSYGVETVRHCVQMRHDSVMIRKTKTYWDAVQAGS